ncbi:MAG: AraC family transcriptional regulator [Anaerolineales bacterium]|nr:AraC family transcriptional regulator [Anaerolineales bacterium]
MPKNETQTFDFEIRASDAPTVERVWRTVSGGAATFISRAATQCELVITRYQGRLSLTVRGPETQASLVPVPPEAEFFGLQFKLGTVLTPFPAHSLVNQGLNLPEAGAQRFWLHGAAWQFPTFENADTFLAQLARQGLLFSEPVVPAALRGDLPHLSRRSVQRRFVRATGLTHTAVLQIERAHAAQALLQSGAPILDVVAQTGYADQPHLTRALRRFVGETPARIAKTAGA